MSKINMGVITTPSTPGAGKVIVFVDVADDKLKQIDDTGTVTDFTASVMGTLDDLSDVTVSTAATDEVLLYNGSQWVNTSLASIKVTYDNTTSGLTATNVKTALDELAAASAGDFVSLTDTPANFTSASLQSVRVNVGETALEFFTPSSSGDLVGPASSTDNAIMRFDSTTGKLAQDSNVTIDDDGRIVQTGLGNSIYIGATSGANDDFSANYNIGIGENTLNANTSGNHNIAFGHHALKINTTQINNIAIGRNALALSAVGTKSIAIGVNSSPNVTLGQNVAVGDTSAFNITSGRFNTCMGQQAGAFQSTGSKNTYLGYLAGSGSFAAHSNNVFLGAETANNVTTGSDNIIIGFNIDLPTATTGNYMNIGNIIEGDVTNGNLGLGTTDYGSGVGVFAMVDATAPSGTPTGGGVLYVESGALKYKGSSGTITTLGIA